MYHHKKRLRPESSEQNTTPFRKNSAPMMTALLVALHFSSTEAFSQISTVSAVSAKRASFLGFRNVGVDDITTTTGAPWLTATPTTAASITSSITSSHLSATDVLPAWLSVPRGHLSETNLQRLQKSLAESHFTENEALKVMYAIEEAAAGDAQLVAGACDFLMLVLETVDMNMDALVAAAFHYCASFNARKQAADRLEHHPNVASFGTAVDTLVRDISRLKELELLAARVMQQNSQAARPKQVDADNLRKLLLSETADWRALAIRTVASLYRLRGIMAAAEDPQRVKLNPQAVQTAREALTIYAPLASRLGMNRLKNELESAAFQILYQRQHSKVNALVQEVRRPFAGFTIGQSMDQLMQQVQEEMTEMFHNDPEFHQHVESFSVTARVKQPYSLWKKMLRDGHSHILDVNDAIALRIVLKAKTMEGEPAEVTQARERALCYYAQNRCTQRWQPVVGNPRFKDYIERPKANGYQSLHYTAMAEFAGENWNMEIQVRSSEMHSVAEYGLASHWDYKLQKKKAKKTLQVEIQDEDIDRSSQAYMRKVQQWHWQHVGTQPEPVIAGLYEGKRNANNKQVPGRESSEHLEPYIRALTAARTDLARDFVFVFLKQNTADARVLALPSGSCVVDAIREGEKSLGVSLWKSHYYDLNGAAATVTRRLSNGDVLTV